MTNSLSYFPFFFPSSRLVVDVVVAQLQHRNAKACAAECSVPYGSLILTSLFFFFTFSSFLHWCGIEKPVYAARSADVHEKEREKMKRKHGLLWTQKKKKNTNKKKKKNGKLFLNARRLRQLWPLFFFFLVCFVFAAPCRVSLPSAFERLSSFTFVFFFFFGWF